MLICIGLVNGEHIAHEKERNKNKKKISVHEYYSFTTQQ